MPAGPRPDPPDFTGKLTFFGLYPPVRWSNVMWIDVTNSGAVSLANLDQIADDAFAAFETHFIPVMNDNVELSGCQLVFWDNTGERQVTSSGFAQGGVSGEIALPANVAIGISWKTAAHYRGGHPRSYMVGGYADQMADVTRLTGGAQTAWASAAAGFRGDIDAIGPFGGVTSCELGVVSFVNGGAWRSPPIFRDFTGEGVDLRIDTQRRRLGPDVPA